MNEFSVTVKFVTSGLDRISNNKNQWLSGAVRLQNTSEACPNSIILNWKQSQVIAYF